jgi:hypothetical protein
VRPRRLIPIAVVGALLVSAQGCGLPSDREARVIGDDQVPYHLLEAATAPSDLPSQNPHSVSEPLVFWVNGSDALVPARTGAECGTGTERLVTQLLEGLAAGPSDERREAGESTAIPPEFSLRLLEVDGGTALVEVGPGPQLSAERLPLAVGQIVLTVSSAPAVDEVVLVVDGEPVQLPRPGGALTQPPVGPSDYASLVPLRYRNTAPFAGQDAACGS